MRSIPWVTCLLLGAVLGAATPGVIRAGVGPDDIPWPVLEPEPDPGRDTQDLAYATRAEALRARWLFRPVDPAAAAAKLGTAGVERVAIIPRFDDLWILEAPFDSVTAVESAWAALGDLRRDLQGRPALARSTALVGVRPYVWNTLGLLGDTGHAVAILDSGCDTAHDGLGDPDFDNQDDPPPPGDADDWRDAALEGYPPDIVYRVVGWHDVTDDMPGSAGPYDYHRHGTELAGAAFGDGSLGSSHQGMAPQGRFVVVKTYNYEGRWMVWASDLLLGIDWVLNHRATYRIQAVLIGAVWDADLDLSAGVRALVNAGIAVVVPAGNDGEDGMGWPARVPEAITVGATTVSGLVTAYSSRSPAGTLSLDLVAPGGSDRTEDGLILLPDNEPNDTYRGRKGTSVAAAHVAGALSLVFQALTESGRSWRNDAAQVRWLEALLTATCVETAGAEIGPGSGPMLNRLGADPVEGHGLLQAGALVDAVHLVLWPGDRATFTLGAPETRQAVWARRIPAMADEALRIELFSPDDADFDLILYREEADGLTPVALSVSPRLGQSEFVQLVRPRMGWYVVVVRRVRGEGEAVLQTDTIVGGDNQWPLRLSSRVVSSPVAHDFDDDGQLEIAAVNTVAIDDLSHTFYVFRHDGSEYGSFPRNVFSPGSLRGQLRSPAVADLGTGWVLISGSEFGVVYGVHASAALQFQTAVTAGLPTTSAAVWGNATQSRILLGVPDGIVVLDATGTEIDRWSIPAGVAHPVALGDLDGDSIEEVVVVDGAGKLWAREIDGSTLPGWPVTVTVGGSTTAPVLLGDGGAPIRVALVEMQPGVTSRVHLYGPDGVPVVGFPRTLTAVPGGSVEASAGVVPARWGPEGSLALVAPALHVVPQGPVSARLHVFDLAGGETLSAEIPVAGPAYTGSSFLVTRRFLAPARVVDVTSRGDAEVWLTLQVAWTEWDGGAQRRFGSVHASIAHVDGIPDPALALETLDGHLPTPPLGMVAPLVADLDGDLLADLVVARNNRLYLQSGRLRTQTAEVWGMERGGGRRAACFDCQTRMAVDAPPGDLPARIGLEVFPNPFNPRTTLHLTAPRGGTATWSVYDARGRRIRRWWRSVPGEGTYRETFDSVDQSGRPLASGVYHLVVEIGGEVVRQRLTLVR